MKKIITTASVVAVGVVGLQGAYAPGLSATERSKPWSISAALRGFYDDNYATLPKHRSDGGATKEESFGFSFSPTLSLNFPFEQTLASLSYTYDLRYYEARKKNSADHGHFVNLALDHAFTEDYKLNLSDSFVIAQEGQLLANPNQPFPTIMRVNGNNIRNIASAKFSGKFTRQLGFLLGYENSIYDYEDVRYKPLLNRMEHMITANLRWMIQPQTVGIFGYQYGIVDYDSNLKFKDAAGNDTAVSARVRDSRSHYIYVGVDQTFNPKLNGSVRLGAQIIDYPNTEDAALRAFTGGDYFVKDTVIPYADANLTYTYSPGSYVQAGVKHTKVTTDLYAQDQEATTVYGSLNHKITAKLTGSLIGQLQFADIEKYTADRNLNPKENYYLVGANLAYQINQYLAAETGYNFDRVDSGVPNRSFSRNRIYLGLRASY